MTDSERDRMLLDDIARRADIYADDCEQSIVIADVAGDNYLEVKLVQQVVLGDGETEDLLAVARISFGPEIDGKRLLKIEPMVSEDVIETTSSQLRKDNGKSPIYVSALPQLLHAALAAF